MEYDDFIKSINSGNITQFSFSIDGYNHYRDCRISRIKDKIFNGKIIEGIKVILTKDESEKVSFLWKFNESFKLFRLGKEGTFTLKQIWNRVIIKSIEYSNSESILTTQ